MLAVKPGAMDAGDAAVGVGHRREQPRPGLADRVTVGAIPERRLKAQRRPVEPCGDAARAQDRKSGVEGKSVMGRVDFGGRGIMKKKNKTREYRCEED